MNRKEKKRKTPSKLKCGFPLWENSEEYCYLMLKKFVFLKGFRQLEGEKKSVQLSPQERTHPIFQFHRIMQFHVKEIVHRLRFLSQKDSEFLIPHHGKGQKGLLIKLFRISDPQDQGTATGQNHLSFFNSSRIQNF